MILSFFNILFKIKGWKLQRPCPPEAHNCIMLAAPHTSNWDFVYAMVALRKLGLFPRFTIKKEFNKPLIGSWISSLGALWIDRSVRKEGEKRPSMTKVMVQMIKDSNEPLTILVTPEGTRSKTTQWKTGFYYTALEAGLPICMAYMDYEKLETGVGACFMPSGNLEDDMAIIMNFYKDIAGKHPEKFAPDERFI